MLQERLPWTRVSLRLLRVESSTSSLPGRRRRVLLPHKPCYHTSNRSRWIITGLLRLPWQQLAHGRTPSCRTLLQAVAAVTVEDVKRVGTLYFSQLFSSSVATCAVCCNPSKVEEVRNELER